MALYVNKKPPVKALLLAGLIVGSIDILIAFIDAWFTYHSTPGRVLKYIASGALGKTVFSGGVSIVLLGVLFHFIIAFSFTFLFYFIYPRLMQLLKNKIVIGILYGIFVWAVMIFAVLPLSLIHQEPFNFLKSLKPILILTVAIGIPLSFMMENIIIDSERKKIIIEP
jgi:hypothetical protein